MTHPSTAENASHETLARALRDEAPRMDDLRRARLERRVLARGRGASAGATTSQGIAPLTELRPTGAWAPSARRALVGGLALAAAALIGFGVRGAMTGPEETGPRFAIGSAFETREGPLAAGARFDLELGEEGRLEIGDVSAALSERGSLEVRSIDPSDVRLVLDRGTAELAFHPRHRGQQRLLVVTPSADVEVVGTIFTVRVTSGGTFVSVREGTVRVTDRAGSPVLVHAGEHVDVPALTAAADSTRTAPSDGPALERARTSDPGAVASAAEEAVRGTAALETREGSGPRSLAFRATRREAASSDPMEAPASIEASASPPPSAPTDAVAATDAMAATSAPPATASEDGLAPPSALESSRELEVDRWAAHRPSSREIAAAWHEIDDLQARGQFERSLTLLVRLERYAPPSDQDEALFDRARTVQEALRRPAAARALYSEYMRRFPDGRHVQEVRRRLETLGGPLATEVEPSDDPPTAQ